MAPKSQWFTAYTKPAGELRAKAFLEGDGIEVYLPVIEKEIVHSGRVDKKPRPVFPRYLFFKGSTNIGKVKNTPGISNVVKFGDEYVVVPNSVIDGLHGLENEAGFVVLTPTPVPLWTPRKGQRVKIASGTWEGKVAIYDGMAGESRVSVLVNIMRRSVKLELGQDQIKEES